MAFGYTDNAETPHAAQQCSPGWEGSQEQVAVSYHRDSSSSFSPHVPFQFDLQRIVIYCDSRHAELETCCDIPTGPVSRHAEWARNVFGLWGLSVQGSGINS